MLFVQFQHKVSHQCKLLNSDGGQLVGREELFEETLEILELIVFPDALLASDELVDPLIVLPSLCLLVTQLVPYPSKSDNVNFHLIAELVDKGKKTEQLADNAAPIRPFTIVSNSCNHNLIDVFLG